MKHASKIVVLLAGVAAASGSGWAAGARGDAASIVLRYSARSLDTDEGMNELYRRIVAASKRVCPEPDSVRDLATRERVQECRLQAVSSSVRQIHHSQFAQVYGSRYKSV